MKIKALTLWQPWAQTTGDIVKGGVPVKEYPIIFSGPMVRAILDGRKTMTRRVINPQPDIEFPNVEFRMMNQGRYIFSSRHGHVEDVSVRKCPYGQPGDRLWLREKWNVERRQLHRGQDSYLIDYAADPGSPTLTVTDNPGAAKYARNLPGWRPSIHMPRWASRLTLEVTEIRVERLQEISEADAHREGWAFQNHDLVETYDPVTMDTARRWFASEWDALNAKRGYPWDSNPWVWIIAFKVVES